MREYRWNPKLKEINAPFKEYFNKTCVILGEGQTLSNGRIAVWATFKDMSRLLVWKDDLTRDEHEDWMDILRGEK